uniref:Uncharacterized protein n=1 Tax=Pyricularia oryzae (strain P131) TaxID=1143193 RepID=L7J529_PYRO1
MEEDERMFETPSMGEQRRERCLWLAYQIAQIGTLGDADKKGEGRWITYNPDTKMFLPAAEYVSDLEIRPLETELASISSRQEAGIENLIDIRIQYNFMELRTAFTGRGRSSWNQCSMGNGTCMLLVPASTDGSQLYRM